MAVKEGVMVGCGEVGDLDYVVVKGKVCKRDKDGNDISADKLGTGGRRREDGSLSALVYDVELAVDADEDGSDDLEEWLRQYALEEQRRKEGQADGSLVAVNQIAYVIGLIADFLEEHPDVVVKIIDGVTTLGRNVTGQFQAIKT